MGPDDSLAHLSGSTETREEQRIEVLGREETRELRQVLQELRVSFSEKHQGPLPRPRDFAEYDSVLPGAAERILRMAEQEQSHRHSMEKEEARQYGQYLDSDIKVIFRGQWFAFILISALIAGSVLLLSQGKNIAALVAFSTAIGTALATHIMGRKNGSKSIPEQSQSKVTHEGKTEGSPSESPTKDEGQPEAQPQLPN